MFKKRSIFRAGAATCMICMLLAPMFWSVRQIGRHIQREKALEVLRANGVIETIYDVVISEDEADEWFDARLAGSMIWSPKPTLFDRIKEFFTKEEDYQTHINVPQRLLPLVPNLLDLFSADELTIVADNP